MVINVSASYIDFIFASNTSFLTTGIEESIYDKCCHNITYRKLNFDIPLPQTYCGKIWDYKKADTEAIERAIYVFNWCNACVAITAAIRETS